MSHHLDSPLARQDVRLDITDLYVFRGETGTVFVINVCHSIANPPSQPIRSCMFRQALAALAGLWSGITRPPGPRGWSRSRNPSSSSDYLWQRHLCHGGA